MHVTRVDTSKRSCMSFVCLSQQPFSRLIRKRRIPSSKIAGGSPFTSVQVCH